MCQSIEPHAQGSSDRGFKIREPLWIKTSLLQSSNTWQWEPHFLLTLVICSPVTQPALSMAQQFLSYCRDWSLPTDQTLGSEHLGEGTLYPLSTFDTQIRPEIQISSFEFNQPSPEMQPEVSVPSYFQVTADQCEPLLQPKVTYVFALASRNNKPVQRQRFNSQGTAHLQQPEVRHTMTFQLHARHCFSTKQGFVTMLRHQHKLISRTKAVIRLPEAQQEFVHTMP